MKFKPILVLALVCAALAWLSFKEPERNQGDLVIGDPRPFAKFKESVSRVILEKGKERLEIANRGGGWRAAMGALDFPVDASKLDGLVRSILELNLIEKWPEDSARSEKNGLNEAGNPLKLTLYSGDKAVLALTLGAGHKGKAAAPGGFNFTPENGQYMMLQGLSGIYLSKEKVNAEFSATFWMKRELAKVEKDKIAAVEIVHPHKTFSLTKEVREVRDSTDPGVAPRQETHWKAQGDLPDGKALQEREVDAFLGKISEIAVSEPVAPKLRSELKVEAPYRARVLTGGNALAFELLADEKGGEWYLWLGSGNQLYKASSWTVEGVFSAAKELFALGERTAKLDDISTLEFAERDLPRLVLSSEAGGWRVAAAGAQPQVDGEKLKGALEGLARMELADYHKGISRDKPEREVAYTLASGGNARILDLGKFPLRTARLFAFEGDPQTYSLHDYDADKIFPPRKELLKFEVKPAAGGDITALKLPSASLERKEGSRLVVAGPAGEVEADEGRLATWFDGYKSALESPYASVAPDFAPQVELDLAATGNVSVKLQISEIANGKAWVRSSLYSGAFEARGEVARALLKDAAFFTKQMPVASGNAAQGPAQPFGPAAQEAVPAPPAEKTGTDDDGKEGGQDHKG